MRDELAAAAAIVLSYIRLCVLSFFSISGIKLFKILLINASFDIRLLTLVLSVLIDDVM
jgi:hypothetical protein